MSWLRASLILRRLVWTTSIRNPRVVENAAPAAVDTLSQPIVRLFEINVEISQMRLNTRSDSQLYPRVMAERDFSSKYTQEDTERLILRQLRHDTLGMWNTLARRLCPLQQSRTQRQTPSPRTR